MARYILGIIATLSILFLLAITAMLALNALPFFGEYSLNDFLLGDKWRPADEPPMFGILPLLWGSLLVTAVAMLFSLPFGIATALYLHGVAPAKVREVIKPAIELLGSIPSVVYGLFGLTLLAPFAQKLLHLTVGQCAAVAGFILGIMAIPIVISVSEDALSAVPKALWEGALAVGSTKWEALTKVILPAAKSGIWAAVLLSFGRAIGETMTVLMVAGGALAVPVSPTEPMMPMTAAIASGIGNAVRGGLQYQALFAIGLILFVITLVVNLVADKVLERQKRKFAR